MKIQGYFTFEHPSYKMVVQQWLHQHLAVLQLFPAMCQPPIDFLLLQTGNLYYPDQGFKMILI